MDGREEVGGEGGGEVKERDERRGEGWRGVAILLQLL